MSKLKLKLGSFFDSFSSLSNAKTAFENYHSVPAEEAAAPLHVPALRQKLVLKEKIPELDGCCTLELASADGGSLAPFQPGQHISLCAAVEGSPVSRPYTLISTPKMAEEGIYQVTIRAAGFLSSYLVNEAQPGEKLTCSLPQGNFCHNSLRDAAHIVAVAGGSGVAGFLSMARSIREGSLKAKLTLLYTCPFEQGFLLKEKLEEAAGPDVKLHFFCPDCPTPEFKPLNAHEVDMAAGSEPYSYFYCGSPEASAVFEKLGMQLAVPPRSIVPGEAGCVLPAKEGEPFALKVHSRTITYTIAALPGETVSTALERAGIPAPLQCRAGVCGFCRSRLIKGEFETIPFFENRTEAEKENGWFHPCCSVPLSDMEIEIFPA